MILRFHKVLGRPERLGTWLLATLTALATGAAEAQTVVPDAVVDTVAKILSQPKEYAPGEKWVRVVNDKRGKPRAMETAIVRYVKADDMEDGKAADQYDQYVDLVGAVHIGDRGYYRQLNRRFKGYDAVLYELVAAAGTVVPKGRGTSNSNPLGALQNGMKSMLEVEHQLEQIDYTRPNMVHADLSPDEFLKSMDDRDEGFAQMYFRMVGASVAQASQQGEEGVTEAELLAAFFAKDRARQLKIAMAKQFQSMESLMMSLSGPKGSTLITERNKRAVDVLEKQLAEGEKRLAIFYGAGHLADMHEQLDKRFDMKPVSIEWLEAWNLRQ